MRAQIFESGFNLWLSANDTYTWAHRAGNSWPCSQLSGKRVFVQFDSNGLCDLTIDGRDGVDCDANELSAIVADHVRRKLPANHPSHFVL